jgi:hypothetical protein
MRAVALLLCFGLAACAGSSFPGMEAEPQAAAVAPAAAPAPAPEPTTPPRPSSRRAAAAGGGGARGGAVTAHAVPEADPDAPTPSADPLTQARANCWMKTEKAKLRDVDARATFVDKCVKDEMKNGPKP